jgi:hypothetical protein
MKAYPSRNPVMRDGQKLPRDLPLRLFHVRAAVSLRIPSQLQGGTGGDFYPHISLSRMRQRCCGNSAEAFVMDSPRWWVFQLQSRVGSRSQAAAGFAAASGKGLRVAKGSRGNGTVA